MHEGESRGGSALAGRVRSGDRLALARSLTLIENQTQDGLEALAALYPLTGKAHIIGVTGAPGTGKSTLVNELAQAFRRNPPEGRDKATTVAIVAVDPSSPFSGGAILGDRIRMRDLAGDSGVFIRSMASRGALGGLARGTAGVVEALDAAGFDKILIETVGAGQAEVDIARTAQTTLVVAAPGLGDDIQALKAGILEIADILVVNKADLPGAENTQRALRAALEMGRVADPMATHGPDPTHPTARESTVDSWAVPVLATVATQGDGIEELVEAVADHRRHLIDSGELVKRERARVRAEMQMLLRDLLAERFLERESDARFEAALERVLTRAVDPRQAVAQLVLETEAEA